MGQRCQECQGCATRDRISIDCGGSITGEHGVGLEKNELMSKQFPPETLAMMSRLKLLFDPEGRLNPGKVLPTGRGCLEIRQQPLTAGTPML